jgi:hypothetical protein
MCSQIIPGVTACVELQAANLGMSEKGSDMVQTGLLTLKEESTGLIL